MPWSIADIADAIHAGLKARAAQDDLEQSVYGFDALDELGLHPLIHAALRAEGYGVWPEQRYPSDRTSKKKTTGKRCDVVLTPEGLSIRDPQVKDTLFDATPAVDLEESYWLEIKTVAQFETDGPFRRYSAELLQPVAHDVKKLWNDASINHAGLLLVLFTADQHIAEHDVAAWHRRCLERGYPVGPPAIRGIKINDRIGNGYCTAAVFGIRGV